MPKWNCNTKICKAWCCKQFVIELKTPPDKDRTLYYKLHGVKVVGSNLIIPLKCMWLKYNYCCGYSSRPELCKKFDCKKFDKKLIY